MFLLSWLLDLATSDFDHVFNNINAVDASTITYVRIDIHNIYRYIYTDINHEDVRNRFVHSPYQFVRSRRTRSAWRPAKVCRANILGEERSSVCLGGSISKNDKVLSTFVASQELGCLMRGTDSVHVLETVFSFVWQPLRLHRAKFLQHPLVIAGDTKQMWIDQRPDLAVYRR